MRVTLWPLCECGLWDGSPSRNARSSMTWPRFSSGLPSKLIRALRRPHLTKLDLERSHREQ
ncbi:unnamed protein product, partial [Ascophyllum nodosum]